MVQASAIERIIQPAQGTLPAELAEYILTLDFPAEDQAAYRALSAKAQKGSLSDEEASVLDDLLTASDVLTILQSKARVSLNRPSAA